MYLLFALAAGLVRCLYINRLYKLSEGVSSVRLVYLRAR